MDPQLDAVTAAALDALNCFSEGVIVADEHHRTRYANAMAMSLLSSSPQELYGRDYRESFPDSKGTAFDELFRRVMSTREQEVAVEHYAPLDRWFRCLVKPCGPGLMVVFSDVTVEHVQQTRLLQDLELLQQVVDHAAVGIALKDLDGRYLLVNRAAAVPTGRPPAEAIGRTAADYYPPEIAARLRADELEVQRTGAVLHREELTEYRAGKPRRYLSVIFPAFDQGGRLVATGAVHSDVTRWKQAEEGLAASEQRFRDVFRDTSLGLVLITPSGLILEANGAYCQMLGYDCADLVGRSMSELTPTREEWDARAERMMAKGRAGYEFEDELPRADGTMLPVQAIVKLVPGEGEPLISVILRDLTEERSLEERVVAAERMEAVGRLAAGISHDVNNVLAAVSGYAQLLSGHLDDPGLVRHLNGIFRSVERASDLVAQLLAFARQQHLDLTEVDLPSVLLDLEDMLRRLLPPGVELTTDCRRVGAVQADAAQVQQVLLNLVLNARDALPDGGRISIAVEAVEVDERSRDAPGVLPAGGYARVTVTDDGAGMPPEVVSRCFEPFFTTRRRSGGNGLGLSTAFGIARQSGGDLRVTSEPGAGTRFELLLPLLRVDEPSGRAVIVLAEDDDAVRHVVKELLTAQGHRVVTAADGAAAVAAADDLEDRPDVLVTDIDMPRLDGPALAAALLERWPGLPVLFISGARPEAGSLPGPLLRKPFSGEELIEAVEALVGRTRR